MKLTDCLTKPLVIVPMQALEKIRAIEELVDAIDRQGLTDSRETLLEAVLHREAQRTTGIGRGFAVPHAKCDAVKTMTVAFGRTAEPIDFGAVDGQPVTLIALLASPTNATGAHIQALAQLSRLVTNEAILSRLLSAPSADEFYQVIVDADGA